MVHHAWRKTLSVNHDTYRIYIGYDSREDIAYQVAKQSILEKSKNPALIEIFPLKLDELRRDGLYWREHDHLGSTEFTFSRFLLPELTDFEGWALFIDCDFLFQVPVEKLFRLADPRYAVMCAQHDYTPLEGLKMDGQQQHNYPRKNWSSMVLWNCGHPSNKQVTKELVNLETTTGAFLHRFSWLQDHEIGEISHEWNWLVGWYHEPEHGKPKALHYTEGGPWFKEYERCEYALDWILAEKRYQKTVKKGEKAFPKMDQFDNYSEEKIKLMQAVLDYSVDPNNYYLGETLETIAERVRKMGNKVAAISSEGGINYQSKGLPYDNLLINFIHGSGGYISDWDREKESDHTLVIRGLGGGSRKALLHCRDTGRHFFAIDTGYFGNDKHKRLHRVTENALQCMTPIKEHDLDRARKFGYKFKKFKPGRKILVCPPSNKVMDYFGQPTPEEWVKDVIEQLRILTDRPVEIRMKPIRSERVSTKTIQQALADDVHCLVTYNSIAAVEALMEGKPAIALGPNAAQTICDSTLKRINDPRIPTQEEMEAFIAHLSYNQFTEAEMREGYAWRQLNENRELPEWDPTKEQ